MSKVFGTVVLCAQPTKLDEILTKPILIRSGWVYIATRQNDCQDSENINFFDLKIRNFFVNQKIVFSLQRYYSSSFRRGKALRVICKWLVETDSLSRAIWLVETENFFSSRRVILYRNKSQANRGQNGWYIFIGKFHKSEHVFWSNQQILLRIVQNSKKNM